MRNWITPNQNFEVKIVNENLEVKYATEGNIEI